MYCPACSQEVQSRSCSYIFVHCIDPVYYSYFSVIHGGLLMLRGLCPNHKSVENSIVSCMTGLSVTSLSSDQHNSLLDAAELK